MSKLVFADKIRELRQNASYTQAEVSRILNIQRQTYCNYENASRTPPLEIIVALAELYHVSVDYLVRGTDTMPDASTRSAQNTFAHKVLGEFVSLPENDQKEVLAFVQFKKLFPTDSIIKCDAGTGKDSCTPSSHKPAAI